MWCNVYNVFVHVWMYKKDTYHHMHTSMRVYGMNVCQKCRENRSGRLLKQKCCTWYSSIILPKLPCSNFLPLWRGYYRYRERIYGLQAAPNSLLIYSRPHHHSFAKLPHVFRALQLLLPQACMCHFGHVLPRVHPFILKAPVEFHSVFWGI